MGRRKSPKLKPKDQLWGGGILLFIAFLFGRCSSGPTSGHNPAPPSQVASTSNTQISPPAPEEPSREQQPTPKESPKAQAEAVVSKQAISKLVAADGAEIFQPTSWKPKSVKLTASVEMIVMENGKYKGKTTVKAGTPVTLAVIKRDTLYVEYSGTMNQIPASSTDLAEQMSKVHVSE